MSTGRVASKQSINYQNWCIYACYRDYSFGKVNNVGFEKMSYLLGGNSFENPDDKHFSVEYVIGVVKGLKCTQYT